MMLFMRTSRPDEQDKKGSKKQDMEKKPGKLKKILKGLGVVLLFILAALCLFNILTVDWGFDNVDNLTWQKIVFLFNSDGTGGNYSLVYKFIYDVAVPILLIVAAGIVAFRLCRKWKDIRMFALVAVVALLAGFSQQQGIYAWDTLGIGEYMEAQNTYSSFIDENYVSPTYLDLEFPEQKRNLIYIFLESMEMTYADEEHGGAFEENCIPELTELALDNECFSATENQLNGAQALPGATWTVGAMFAQTSGLPLMINIDENAMSTQESFLPGVTSLGDILEDEGYHQVLMVGSDATYGGRKLYFQEHGDYEILDYNTYIENGTLPEDYRVWWGFEDAKLFDYAKDELTELASSDQPFNLTMLTVDTHFEDGYLCEDCPDSYDSQYANVMACSSARVAEFLEWIQQQDFYENTTVVICGDHTTMDSDFCKNISKDYVRRTYVNYVNSAVSVDEDAEEDRVYSTMDLFPTTLASLGVEIPGNRLGLGSNLFSDRETLLEEYSEDEVNTGLQEQSALFESLTEDIQEISADVSYKPLKEDSTTLDLTIKNVSSDKINGFQVVCKGNAEDAGRKWYKVTEAGKDGSYKVSVPLEDFAGSEKISVQVYSTVDGQTGPAVFSKSISLPNSDISKYTTITVGDYDYTVGYFPVNVTLDSSIRSEVSSVKIAVWSAEDQSDLQWYEADNQGDGSYELDVLARDFGFVEGTYQIDVYVTLQNGREVSVGRTEGVI